MEIVNERRTPEFLEDDSLRKFSSYMQSPIWIEEEEFAVSPTIYETSLNDIVSDKLTCI